MLNRFKEAELSIYNATYNTAVKNITQLVEEIKSDPKLENSDIIEDIPYFYNTESKWSSIKSDDVNERFKRGDIFCY